ncbi:MAG TPA: cob(I)yrinic acid a,c-diamide adenosyltransferase [Cyclobacteriaceae bacterium]|nr:cob(I)yrinic acid a,c-diamide adenosyltransferase [Cyclobacteriaceae bacterium]
MKIYTKTGDSGTTSLFGGTRLSKANMRIETYGTVDELNAHLGLLRDQEVNQKRQALLISIQENLFTIGAMLAAEPGNNKIKIPNITEAHIQQLESAIDEMDSQLSPMRNFVLPGGHQAVSIAHICRTVCRRAERLCVALHEAEGVHELVIKYLNRLSDYLFVLSRMISQELGATESPWKPQV